MGGYESIIKWKGKRYLKMQQLHMYVPVGNRLTKKGADLADEMAQQAAKALVRRAEKKGIIPNG